MKNIDIDINIDKNNLENIAIDIDKTILENIDIAINIDGVNLGNIAIDKDYLEKIKIVKNILENIDINIDIFKDILGQKYIFSADLRLFS